MSQPQKNPPMQSPTTASSAKRRPGRPRRREPVVTPAIVQAIADHLLEGLAVREIGRRLEIDKTTVARVRDTILRPQWEDEARGQRAFQLAKVDHLEAFAWNRLRAPTQPTWRKQIKKTLREGGNDLELVERVMGKVTRTGEVCWAQVIQWCADYRARVFGYYSPLKHEVGVNELRVAGPDPTAVDQAMIERLVEKIRERQAFHAVIKRGRNR